MWIGRSFRGSWRRRQNPDFVSSSPREERAGRGPRRGEFPIKTRLLSPALSSIRWRRGRKIVGHPLPPGVLAHLTQHGRFTRRLPDLESRPHTSFAKEEARWPSMELRASPKTSFAVCWTKPFREKPARPSILD